MTAADSDILLSLLSMSWRGNQVILKYWVIRVEKSFCPMVKLELTCDGKVLLRDNGAQAWILLHQIYYCLVLAVQLKETDVRRVVITETLVSKTM